MTGDKRTIWKLHRIGLLYCKFQAPRFAKAWRQWIKTFKAVQEKKLENKWIYWNLDII